MSDRAGWVELVHITLRGEWWWLSAALAAIYDLAEPRPPRAPGGFAGLLRMTEIAYTVTHTGTGEVLGSATFSRSGATTTLRIQGPPQFAAYWADLEHRLETMTTIAWQHRTAMFPSAEEAIEHYYRSRARGSKMTLKELAEISGYGYGYLRDVKARYDRDPGKWGSKAAKQTGARRARGTPPPDNDRQE